MVVMSSVSTSDEWTANGHASAISPLLYCGSSSNVEYVVGQVLRRSRELADPGDAAQRASGVALFVGVCTSADDSYMQGEGEHSNCFLRLPLTFVIVSLLAVSVAVFMFALKMSSAVLPS